MSRYEDKTYGATWVPCYDGIYTLIGGRDVGPFWSTWPDRRQGCSNSPSAPGG